eukprot:4574350-Pleurochrysis_carterae.AAC.1
MSHGCGVSDGGNTRDGRCETDGTCVEGRNRWSVAMPQRRSDAQGVTVAMTVTNSAAKKQHLNVARLRRE